MAKIQPDSGTFNDITDKVLTAPKKLALNDATADFAVICESRCYMVHRRVLEKESPYFEGMFRFNGVEVDDKKVKLSDVDMYLMKHVLEFMYNSEYTLPSGTVVPTTGYCNHTTAALRDGPLRGPAIFKRKCICSGKTLSPSHLMMHICIYAIADYLGMAALKTYAYQGATDVLHVYWDDEELELADALEEAFTSTPEDDRCIRDVLISTLKEHPGLWVDEGNVHEWLNDNPKELEEVESDWVVPWFSS
ncbi:uncharacterized protein K460DRAFT_277210 [Cucurbitaria berberidis CBS 394.84]|uniref:BTB domain-containing protein n=1 Tax=Cucurbitaria berberidis CBS 394.84 TaxID=1168544 RepID=A0A9P4LAT8_9PLEO|nr:uncharacterized protein K460DRAFT_277210 [Cucurbitaria berberidis CBS 394.84]KAF1848766.1 hypothetical protein K460DRAFT_277210 [Cucurbitaria berberidis CBS 394.84]